jgi:flagellar basal-body rod protein FlgC
MIQCVSKPNKHAEKLMSNILSIAVSGLNDAATRIANAASNIVNASSTSKLPASGQGYNGFTPQDVVSLSSGTGVTSTLQPRTPAYNTISDATSPNANAQGLVASPNVDLNSELIASKDAQVQYGADAKLIKIVNEMDKSLLDAIS